MKKEVLAINKSHKNERYDAIHNCDTVITGLASLLFLCEAYHILFLSNVEVLWPLLPLSIAMSILFGFVSFLYLDIYYLRWHRTTETVSVQSELLVIEYSKSIFKHRMEIPLSTIRSVETYNGRNGWLWGLAPETLRVIYSYKRGYKFGICMTDFERDALAKRITDLTRQYV